jgi:hypothetical protein
MVIQELYKPIVIGVNSTWTIPYGTLGIAGFLCAVSGTISVTNERGVLIVNALPVTAGVYYPMPFQLDVGELGNVTTAGGARGTLAVV